MYTCPYAVQLLVVGTAQEKQCPGHYPCKAANATNCSRNFLSTDGSSPAVFYGLWTISSHTRRKSIVFVGFRSMEMKYSDLCV